MGQRWAPRLVGSGCVRISFCVGSPFPFLLSTSCLRFSYFFFFFSCFLLPRSLTRLSSFPQTLPPLRYTSHPKPRLPSRTPIYLRRGGPDVQVRPCAGGAQLRGAAGGEQGRAGAAGRAGRDGGGVSVACTVPGDVQVFGLPIKQSTVNIHSPPQRPAIQAEVEVHEMCKTNASRCYCHPRRPSRTAILILQLYTCFWHPHRTKPISTPNIHADIAIIRPALGEW